MAEATVTQPEPINRREFLYYVWGASIAVLLAGSGGAILWFIYPRFREGEFGGKFPVPLASLPAPGDAPVENAAGRFWLVTTPAGLVALYKVCTHLGCLYKWVPNNDRFECPCHGSKFTKQGEWIEGPAPRGLDQMAVEILDESGSVIAITDDEGSPVPIEGAASIAVDTGVIILGEQNA
ncbi:MAG: Rieske 2Fe-2S domain-containing protein [Chloroflexi bacterium]|nr:Rieske 2Fe-2S domain-containing protein [Chloroflexota bacterium]